MLCRLLSSDWIGMSGGFAFALANAAVASAHHVYLFWIATFLAGAAWVAVTATFNSSAQMALPAWVRARALSLYLALQKHSCHRGQSKAAGAEWIIAPPAVTTFIRLQWSRA